QRDSGNSTPTPLSAVLRPVFMLRTGRSELARGARTAPRRPPLFFRCVCVSTRVEAQKQKILLPRCASHIGQMPPWSKMSKEAIATIGGQLVSCHGAPICPAGEFAD